MIYLTGHLIPEHFLFCVMTSLVVPKMAAKKNKVNISEVIEQN